MKNDPKSLVASLLKGSVPALARVLSLIEENSSKAQECLSLIFPHTGNCQVVGVTGSPGAGKSTLVDKMVRKLRENDQKVAVLAVDPTSPFSGGALLGDRIRMSEIADDSGVFIRSMATRGALGGLAPRTAESIFAFDAAGYDYVIVETVGVGQAEVEIVRLADTVVLVLVPGMGDEVQALKAGIIEIADIYAINKSDFDGVERLVKELRTVLGLAENVQWEAPISKVIASKGEGISELLAHIAKHNSWSNNSGDASERRNRFFVDVLKRRLSESLYFDAMQSLERDNVFDEALKEVIDRKLDPGRAALKMVEYLNLNK